MPTAEMDLSGCNLLSYNDLLRAGWHSVVPVASDFRAKAIRTEEILYGADSCTRRRKSGNDFPFVAPVDSEIAFIHSDHQMAGIEFTHPYQAQIG
jgi:hypothetical protein